METLSAEVLTRLFPGIKWDRVGAQLGPADIVRTLAMRGGSVDEALAQVFAAREASPAFKNHPALVGADHYAQALRTLTDLGPVGGRVNLAVNVPGYQVAKGLAQTAPTPVGQAMDRLLHLQAGVPGPGALTEASPPSWSQVRWGLTPVFSGTPEWAR